MTDVKLTGPELETLGLMKFSCATCREIFPVRCDEHRRLPEEEPEPPKLKLLLVARNPLSKVLAFGRPIPGYTAPYEHLETDIEGILSQVSD